MVSQQRESTSTFYHFDGTANTMALTDNTNVETDRYVVDAWGEERSTTGTTPNAHIYKGQLNAYYNDPHAGPGSIYSIGPRKYSVKQKRWTSDDPRLGGIAERT
ncbi:hypothetical protein [Thalassoglobus neptunius]|uniref:hypothetical protein n=1 Tax=Thalassoglobus neptunius TaxID=1938619 RepID=UPI001E3CCB09|nr:hypothetical protein [Thalassoglobus neptunius]